MAGEDDFTRIAGPFRYFGEVGKAGQLVKIVPIEVEFEGAPFSKLNLIYDSVVGAGILGEGWRLPLLESGVYLLDENRLEWEQIDGQRILLERKGHQKFVSRDYVWTAEQDDDQNLLISQSENSEIYFSYEAGKIKSFSLGGGEVYVIEKQNSDISLSDGGGKKLIGVTFLDSGIVQELLVGGNVYEFGYEDVPLFHVGENINIITALKPSLSSISCRGKGEIYRNVTEIRDYGLRKSGHLRGEEFVHDLSRSGSLEGSGGYTYKLALNKDGRVSQFTRLSKVSGTEERYEVDDRSGIYSYFASDGAEYKYHRIHTPGKSFNKVRRIEKLISSGRKDDATFSYDVDGNVLRAISGDQVTQINRNGEIEYIFGEVPGKIVISSTNSDQKKE